MTRPILFCLGLAALGLAALPAAAEVRLAESTPAAAASAGNVDKLTLRFSEAIAPGSLTVDLAMTGMPGMTHHAPMKVTGFATTLAPDATSATLALPRALPTGTYEVTWRATSTAGSAAGGSYGFSAR